MPTSWMTLLLCATLGEGNGAPPARLIEVPPLRDDMLVKTECEKRGLAVSLAEERTARRELMRLVYERSFAQRTKATLARLGFRPDLIYERHALFHCAGAALARTLGVPRFLEVNAPLIGEQEKFRGLCLKQIAVATEQASFAGADRIIAVSDEVASYVASLGIAGERIATVPNGVDTGRFRPDAGGDVVRGADLVVTAVQEGRALLQRMSSATSQIVGDLENIRDRHSLKGLYGKSGKRVTGPEDKRRRIDKTI